MDMNCWMYIAALPTSRLSPARSLRARRSQLRASPRDPLVRTANYLRYGVPYRVGDCRVICHIQDGALRVLVV